ncbi:MAG: DUF952 domain-containing protein [Cyanobacteria bacterium P01_G01_bin.49]
MIIFHLTTAEDWQKAEKLGKYKAPSLEREGFIHCSTKPQVTIIANTFYSEYCELTLLEIDTEKLISEVRWESPVHPNSHVSHKINNNDKFPHVYGAINLEAIIQIIPLKKKSSQSQFVIT